MKNPKTAGTDRGLNKQNSSHQVFIIAETGTSHNGSLERATELIHAAAAAGADCVKTQIVIADEIIHPETGEVALPGGSIRLYDRFRELEQNIEFYLAMKEITEKAGMEFLASPFGKESLNQLLMLGCSSIKIASPELNHFPLLEQAAAAQKKIILSTGVSTLEDIAAALAVTGNLNTVLLHCITSYPAPEDEYNLRLIPFFIDHFRVAAGVSDHSLDPLLVPSVSAAAGATVIEKHIALDNAGGGLDDPIALTPDKFAMMSAAVREFEKIPAKDRIYAAEARFGRERVKSILGDGKKRLAESELRNYGRTNRSVHAVSGLAEGTVLTEQNTALLRTEKKLRPGIRPEFYNEIIGKKLVCPVKPGDGIRADDLGLDRPGMDFPL